MLKKILGFSWKSDGMIPAFPLDDMCQRRGTKTCLKEIICGWWRRGFLEDDRILLERSCWMTQEVISWWRRSASEDDAFLGLRMTHSWSVATLVLQTALSWQTLQQQETQGHQHPHLHYHHNQHHYHQDHHCRCHGRHHLHVHHHRLQLRHCHPFLMKSRQATGWLAHGGSALPQPPPPPRVAMGHRSGVNMRGI